MRQNWQATVALVKSKLTGFCTMIVPMNLVVAGTVIFVMCQMRHALFNVEIGQVSRLAATSSFDIILVQQLFMYQEKCISVLG